MLYTDIKLLYEVGVYPENFITYVNGLVSACKNIQGECVDKLYRNLCGNSKYISDIIGLTKAPVHK